MGNFSSSSKLEVPDLTGHVAVVTGANKGIGFYTVLHLAKGGAKVYLGARSEEKAKAAIEQLRAKGLGDKADNIVWLDIDLTYPRKAKEAAEFILAHEQRLDILINNAGKQVKPWSRTSDGLSDSMAINHLSPFLFTNTLLPLMKTTAQLPDSDVRIVNVSSVAHSWINNPKYDSLEALNSDFSSAFNPSLELYCYTKLANILHAKELQKRLDADKIPIVVTSIHPGGVWTDGAQAYLKTKPPKRLWLGILWLFLGPLERGADTSVFAAVSPIVCADPEKYKGKYLVPVGKLKALNAHARNPQLAQDLWETSEKQLARLQL